MKNISTLKNSLQFKEVYGRGKSIANKYLVMYVLPGKGEFRLGISVSKKVGNSVTRHHITRLIRESYLLHKEQIPDDIHMVVVARSSVKDRSFTEVRDAFAHLIRLHGISGSGEENDQRNTDRVD